MITLAVLLSILFGKKSQRSFRWDERLALCLNLVCDPAIIWVSFVPHQKKTQSLLIFGLLAALVDGWAIWRILFHRRLGWIAHNGVKLHQLVWWALWGAFQIGIAMIYYLVGVKHVAPISAIRNKLWWCAIILPLGCSIAVRWVLLVRARTARLALIWFCIGLVFAESSYWLGLFLLPEYIKVFFMLSFLGVLQFIPLFGRRSFESEDQVQVKGQGCSAPPKIRSVVKLRKQPLE